MTRLRTWLRAFGQFWWDFFVGDTPELFVATVALIAVTAVLVHAHAARSVATALLPLLVIGALLWSVRKSWPKR